MDGPPRGGPPPRRVTRAATHSNKIDARQDVATGLARIVQAAKGGAPVFVDHADAEFQRLMAEAIGAAPAAGAFAVSRPEGTSVVFTIPGSSRVDGDEVLARLGVERMAKSTFSDGADQGNDSYAPVVSFVASITDPDSARTMSSTKRVTVGREIRAQGDQFSALVRDSLNYSSPDLRYLEKWQAAALKSLTLESLVRTKSGAARVAQIPETDGRTALAFTGSRSQTIGFTVNGGWDRGASAGPKNLELTGKSNLSLGFNWSRTTEESLDWSLNDYSVEKNLQRRVEGADTIDVGSTTTRLSPAIAEDAAFFSGPSRYTPSMQRQGLQQIAEWVIPEGEKKVTFSSHAAGEFTRFDGWHTKDVPADISDVEFATVVVDLTSPFLSRNTTVHIQSLSTGALLHELDGRVYATEAGTLRLDQKDYQWELDEIGRYQVQTPRGRRYLTVEADGSLKTNVASLGLDQQWQWQADRLHSRANPRGVPGVLPIRLLMEGRSPRGVSGEAARQYPVNPESPILPPWSSYPGKPVVGDTVPRVGPGPLTPISPDWISEGYQVTPSEQWKVIVVRQGLS